MTFYQYSLGSAIFGLVLTKLSRFDLVYLMVYQPLMGYLMPKFESLVNVWW